MFSWYDVIQLKKPVLCRSAVTSPRPRLLPSGQDPTPEHAVRSLSLLRPLQSLSLDVAASALPLPAACPALCGLRQLGLAVVLRGYGAGRGEQVRCSQKRGCPLCGCAVWTPWSNA